MAVYARVQLLTDSHFRVGFNTAGVPISIIASNGKVTPIATFVLDASDNITGFVNPNTGATVPFPVAGYNPASVALTGGTINGTPIGPTTPSTGSFTTLQNSGVMKTVAAARSINVTAAAAASTVPAAKSSHYIATPAAAITVTLPAPTADGDRCRVVFGAATTVTWAVTAPATATVIPKTSFTAGESIELVYNAVAGTPVNAAATTWYIL